MIGRIVAALAYGVGVALVCILIGILVSGIGQGPFNDVGQFFTNYAWIIGFVVAVLAFFGNWSLPRFGP